MELKNQRENAEPDHALKKRPRDVEVNIDSNDAGKP